MTRPPPASWASSPAVRASMLGNRSRDTAPELAVRRAVHALGLRYRVCAPPLPWLRRTGDLVFRRARVAVFVDGCFWHGCPDHGTRPRTNAGYWSAKVDVNRCRDADTDRRLCEAGWLAVRAWEHEEPGAVARRVQAAVAARLSAGCGAAPVAAAPGWRTATDCHPLGRARTDQLGDVSAGSGHAMINESAPPGRRATRKVSKHMGKYGDDKRQRGFVMEDVIWDAASARAKANDTSVSEIIRLALEAYSEGESGVQFGKLGAQKAATTAAKKAPAKAATTAKAAPAKAPAKKAPAAKATPTKAPARRNGGTTTEQVVTAAGRTTRRRITAGV